MTRDAVIQTNFIIVRFFNSLKQSWKVPLFIAYWMMQMKSTCTNLKENIIFHTTFILMLKAFQMCYILSTHSSRDTISALNRLESKNVTKKEQWKENHWLLSDDYLGKVSYLIYGNHNCDFWGVMQEKSNIIIQG